MQADSSVLEVLGREETLAAVADAIGLHTELMLSAGSFVSVNVDVDEAVKSVIAAIKDKVERV